MDEEEEEYELFAGILGGVQRVQCQFLPELANADALVKYDNVLRLRSRVN